MITCRKCTKIKKHQAKWLCKSCYDYNLRKRKKRNYYRIHERKYRIKIKILKILDTVDLLIDKRKLKRWKFFDKNKNAQKYRQKNIEVIRLAEKIRYRRSVWLPCLEMRINWKTRYFPFSWIDKPCIIKLESKEYKEYVKRSKEFDILKKWYEEKTK